MTRVPVVLFIHARPRETAEVFESIRRSRPEVLYIFADGPRREKDHEVELCEEARRVTEQVDWTCEVKRIYRESNIGLAKSIFYGLDQVFDTHTSALVLEDDCVPCPEFFTFAESALFALVDEKQVAMVSGNNFGNQYADSLPFFSGHPRIWGWATWSDRWQAFRNSMADMETSYSWAVCSQAIPGWFERILFWSLQRNSDALDSWAVSFAKHIHRNHFLCLNPGTNLVENVGFSHSASHTNAERLFLSVKASPLGINKLDNISIQRSLSRERWVSRSQLTRLIQKLLAEPSLAISMLALSFAHAKRLFWIKSSDS